MTEGTEWVGVQLSGSGFINPEDEVIEVGEGDDHEVVIRIKDDLNIFLSYRLALQLAEKIRDCVSAAKGEETDDE